MEQPETTTNEQPNIAAETPVWKQTMQQVNIWMSGNIAFLLFLFVLVILYIRNIHFSEELIRDIEKTKAKTKDMRWEYMTVKAELMFQTKQTEIAKLVANQGLKELTEPPKKISIKKQ